MESLEPNFWNGANFAVAGTSTLSKGGCFNLNTQIQQFRRFQNHSVLLHSKGYKNLVGEEDFKNPLYIIDIGQNDLTKAFNDFPDDEAVEKIPSFISEIKDAMWAIYQQGGRNLWVHNTGPLGCLPEKLGTRRPNASQVDENGCIAIMNEAAQEFNSQLYNLCNQLRDEMNNSTIVYVDVYSIKYSIIANSSLFGFKNPLAACCGNGGLPYNFDPNRQCRGSSYTLCDEENISWDGTHYIEAANSIVASAILSTKCSTPSLPFDFFCNQA